MRKQKVLIRAGLDVDINGIILMGEVYHRESKSRIGDLTFNYLKTEMSIIEAYVDRNQQIFVATDNGQLLGFMWCVVLDSTFSNDRIANDKFLYVSAKCRGLGIGHDLTLAFEKWAIACGATTIVTGANSGIDEKADKMYSDRGYSYIGKNYMKIL
jgi:GNAT superfamily N-acetyltransferase